MLLMGLYCQGVHVANGFILPSGHVANGFMLPRCSCC